MADRERQLERAQEALAAKDEEARAKSERGQQGAADRPQDEQDARAEDSGHGEKTADKSNQ